MNTMYTMVWVSYVTISLVCGVLPGRGQQESCASKPVCGKPVPSGSIQYSAGIVPPTVIVKCVVYPSTSVVTRQRSTQVAGYISTNIYNI